MKTATVVANLLLLSSLSFALGVQNSSPTSTPTPATGEASKRPKKLRVSSAVADRQLLQRVNPTYPAKAIKDHIQGDVILQFTINKQGDVTQLRLVKGKPILADAALDAVKQWKFSPYLVSGEPVEVETTVRIIFHM